MSKDVKQLLLQKRNDKKKDKETNVTPRLTLNKLRGPVVHMKVQKKYKDDLFLLENEEGEPMMRINHKGNIDITSNVEQRSDTPTNFEEGIILGCWKIVPTEDQLRIKKLVNGEWVTKHMLS